MQYVGGALGVLPNLEGVMKIQLNLPFLMLLSIVCCGQLQLGAPHRATSVALLQVVYN